MARHLGQPRVKRENATTLLVVAFAATLGLLAWALLLLAR